MKQKNFRPDIKVKEPKARHRNGPGRPTLEDLELRKSKILDVAAALFVQRGYAETSLVDVAKLAGVATRTIYQHYGDKDDIFRAVIDKRFTATEHEIPVSKVDDDLFDILLATAHYICAVSFSDTAPSFQRLMIAESHRFPDVMRQIFDMTYNRLHSNVIATFKRLAHERKIPASDHTENAKYFIDLLLGTAPMQLAMNWITSGPSEAELRDKISLFILGRFNIQPTTKTGKPAAPTVAAKRKRS